MDFKNNTYSIMQKILFYAITLTGETTTSNDKKGNNSLTIIAVAVSAGFLLLIIIIIVLAVCLVKRSSVQRFVVTSASMLTLVEKRKYSTRITYA